jgi:hypothetical protein
MATPNLVPGSIVNQSGIYRIPHSTGHMQDAECDLTEGLLLTTCMTGCHVMYTFLRQGQLLPDDKHPQ